jgi:hypothetical protein
MWTSIDPVAFADAGEKMPFCPLLIWIGVRPETLLFDDAVRAASAIKDILKLAGFNEIEVAFRESEVTQSIAGPRLLSFNPLSDPVPKFRKPFTPILGLPIAPLKTPQYEGTGALYLRLNKDDNSVALLTAAHVARPLPVCANTGMSHKSSSQPREEIVSLGHMGFQNATNAMMSKIGELSDCVELWRKTITRLGKFVEGENRTVTRNRRATENAIEEATEAIGDLEELYNEVTSRRMILEQRVIGFVLHAEPIVPGDTSYLFTRDWALIQLYCERIDWSTFPGNKVYIGTFPVLSRSFQFWLTTISLQVATSRPPNLADSCSRGPRTGRATGIRKMGSSGPLAS